MPKFEKGAYKAVVTEQGFDEGQYGVQFFIRFRIENTDQERTAFMSLIDKDGQPATFPDGSSASDKTIDTLVYLGFNGDAGKLSLLDPQHPDCHSFVGQEIEAYCSPKTVDGATKERWYINTPGGSFAATPPASKTMKTLDALFGRELKARKKQAAYSEPAKPDPPKKPISEVVASPEEVDAELAESSDDIPF